MKRYTVTFIISRDLKEVLLLYKFWGPFPNKYNGVGGKIEENENLLDSAIRECWEETGLLLQAEEIEFLMQIVFPYGVELNVFYVVVDKFEPTNSEEGILKWLPVEFALDFNNPHVAGDGNVAYFLREALSIIRSK